MPAEWISAFDVFKEPFIIGICIALKGAPKIFFDSLAWIAPDLPHCVLFGSFMKDTHDDFKKVPTALTPLPLQLS